MAADLRLVTHATEGDADEGTPGGVGDRLTEGRLADARRSDEAEQRALGVAGQLEHRDVLEDALLDVLETVVVLGELGGDLVEIDVRLAPLVPRQVGDELEVVPDDVDLGALAAHALEPAQLAVDDLLRVLGKTCLLEALLQAGELVGLAVTELLLDGAHVLAENVLALVLSELLLDLALDLGADLGLRLALADALHEEPDAGRHVGLAEELHLLLDGEVEERGELVGELTGVRRLDLELAERAARLADDLDDLLRERTSELLRFHGVVVRLGQVGDLGLVERVGRDEVLEARAAKALERELVLAVALAGDRLHAGVGAERVDVALREVDGTGILLAQRQDDVARVEGADERDGARAADREGEGGPGEQHPGAEGQCSDGGSGHGHAITELGHRRGLLVLRQQPAGRAHGALARWTSDPPFFRSTFERARSLNRLVAGT